MRTVLKAIIRGYRYLISPLLGPNCRFYPSCSCYAEEAVVLHGSMKGSYLAARRILRCHPWHPGGYDPVPQTLRVDLTTTGAPAAAARSESISDEAAADPAH